MIWAGWNVYLDDAEWDPAGFGGMVVCMGDYSDPLTSGASNITQNVAGGVSIYDDRFSMVTIWENAMRPSILEHEED